MSKKSKNIVESFNLDYETIIKDVAKYQIAIQEIPKLVKGEINKAWKQLPNSDPARSPKSWVQDPLSLQYSLGYKDRRFSLTYDTLKRMAMQLSLVGAIINTRCAQVASFSEPYRKTRSLGFEIRHKDPDHPTTTAEVAFIKELENFIVNCGRSEPNPYSRVKRDDFDSFLRKIVRDTLTYDQVAVEIVPDRFELPYEFLAIDASTIRFASDTRYVGINSSYTERSGFVPSVPMRYAGLYEGSEYGTRTASGDLVSYVQIVNGQIENVYSDKELAVGIRNPRTDIYCQGYGQSELEQAITIVTSHLYAEEWNRKIFSQGAVPKGILNLKGDNWTPEMLEGFKRQWHAQVSGVENAFRTPILQSEGLEWIDLHRGNAEMEYGKWLEYLIKTLCGVYLIDPAEINFQIQGGVSQTPLFESSQEWKLKASRDRGLKPLLKFISRLINKYIIDPIDSHFTFEFVGLDELTEEEKHELLVEKLSSYMTLNEVRRANDLPELPGGDTPLNPVYLQALEQQRNVQLQDQQMQAMQAQQQLPQEQEQAQLPAAQGSGNPSMNYTDNYAFNNPKPVV